MVDQSMIGAMAFNTLFSYSLPVAGMAYLSSSNKRAVKQAAAGAGVFLIFQAFLPALTQILTSMSGVRALTALPWVSALLSAVAAGVSAEVGRYIGFYAMLPRRRGSWRDALSFGIGNGGVESVMLASTSNLQSLIAAFCLNSGLSTGWLGVMESDILGRITVGIPLDALLTGLERVPAMLIQIALSFLVLRALNRRKLRFLGKAVLLHALIAIPPGVLPALLGEHPYIQYIIQALTLAEGIAALIFVAGRIRSKRV